MWRIFHNSILYFPTNKGCSKTKIPERRQQHPETFYSVKLTKPQCEKSLLQSLSCNTVCWHSILLSSKYQDTKYYFCEKCNVRCLPPPTTTRSNWYMNVFILSRVQESSANYLLLLGCISISRQHDHDKQCVKDIINQV